MPIAALMRESMPPSSPREQLLLNMGSVRTKSDLINAQPSTTTAPYRHHAHPEDQEAYPHHQQPINAPPSPPTPLRFIFSGYSIWLELKQHNISENGRGDLSRMVDDAADRFQTSPIPMPHVTALYGINHMDEGDVKRIFREDVIEVLKEKAVERSKHCDDSRTIQSLWPDLIAEGVLVDVEYDGVGNGTMDMAWAEVTFATSPQHEELIDALYNLFCMQLKSNGDNSISSPRTLPWAPHLSICYDNPEKFPSNISRESITQFINEKALSLKGAITENTNFSRQVCGISLWSTAGTMSHWKCLDRIHF